MSGPTPNPGPAATPLLTADACAARLGVSRGLIYAALAAGTLPGYRLGRPGRRGSWRVAARDLDAWVHSLRTAAPPLTTPTAPPARPAGGFKHLRL